MSEILMQTDTIEAMKQRYLAVTNRIAGCNASHMTKLLAVSKSQSVESIGVLVGMGHVQFGENYVQELERKALAMSGVEWHFIGNLQSNKVKQVLKYATCIQSVDRMGLMKEILKHAMRPIQFLIQLQVDALDTNKSGATAEQASEMLRFWQESRNPLVTWGGFMGIGPADCDTTRLKDLYTAMIAKSNILWRDFNGTGAPQHSLGMSQDLEIAIAAGSSMVRIGTDLFGPRQKQL